MEHFILEACVDSVESAMAAVHGGATRLELCANRIIGGTTPSPYLYQEIRKYTDIPIRVLIRPRFGDFCYTDSELSIMKEEVAAFQRLGAQGVVIGILKENGSLNIEQMKELAQQAEGMSLTLHRAFDVCAEPMEALEQAIELGFDTILTSGQQNSCIEGAELLRELVCQSKGRIEIQVGSGVNAKAIEVLYPITHAKAYHMSGKVTQDSNMKYRKPGVSMGLGSISEYEIWQTDEALIREARCVLEGL